MKKLCISLLALITLLTINSFADGWYFDGANWKYEDKDGSYITGEIKKSNGISYYLDDDGNMAKDYLAEVNGNYYYFDSNGAMVTNTWVALDPSMIEDQPFDANAYFMYFGANGKAIKGDDGKKKDIDGKTYMFNNNGIMMVGWLTENGEYLDNEDSDDWYSSDAMYFAREDGSLAEGWLPLNDYHLEEEITNAAGDPLYLETIWFYFDPTSHKKATSEKTINGRKYNFFEDNGRMMTTWEYLEREYGDAANSIIATNNSANKYYGEYYDGSLAKNRWVYAIPSIVIDEDLYNDYEYKWLYAKNNGGFETDIRKKINNKYYLFDKKGIMKTGLVLLYQNKYFCNIDLEETDYEDFTKHFRFVADGKEDVAYADGDSFWNEVDSEGYINNFFMAKMPKGEKDFQLKYFGDDGAEKVGNSIPIEFNDGEYLFYSDNKGALREWNHKKYYQNGFLLKANEGQKYGIMIDWGQLCRGGGATEGLGTETIPPGTTQLSNTLTKSSYIAEYVVNYGYGVANHVFNYGIKAEDLVADFPERADPYPSVDEVLNPDNPLSLYSLMISTCHRPLWHLYYPVGVLIFDLADYAMYREDLSIPGTYNLAPETLSRFGDGLVTNTSSGSLWHHDRTKLSNFTNLLNSSGKVMKKGAYKSDGNYYLVDRNNQFVGLFNVPVKWDDYYTESFTIVECDPALGEITTDFVLPYDIPYYKSTVIDDKGNEKEKWIKFGDKDGYGKTELDYVVNLSDEDCINFSIGDNFPTIFSGVSE